MDDQERFDRFLSALAFRATLDDGASTGVELSDLDGEPVEPSVRLHVDARALAEHVRDDEGRPPTARQPESDVESGLSGGLSGDRSDDLSGDLDDDLDDPEADRLQTLLAQIEEAILVREPGHDHLVLVAGGVKAVRADEVAA